MAYGTLMSWDTLAASLATVQNLGEDRVFEAIDQRLAVHNALVREKVDELVEFTDVQLARWGDVDTLTMEELSELGTPNAQKMTTTGLTVGFPLRLYGVTLQWTRTFFKNASGKEIANQVKAAEDADLRAIDYEIKRALFRPTNYTFTDRLSKNRADLPIKVLLNADGAAIPPGVEGITFDPNTHTHYLATASLIASNLQALIETVIEHHADGRAVVDINRGNETAVRALTGFVAYPPEFLQYGSGVTVARGLAPTNQVYNRAIGMFEANGVSAEIRVKPWIPLNYLFAHLIGGTEKLVRLRVREGEPETQGNLELVFEDEVHPLRARVLEREFGAGVWTRSAGAILYAGGGSYVQPTFTQ